MTYHTPGGGLSSQDSGKGTSKDDDETTKGGRDDHVRMKIRCLKAVVVKSNEDAGQDLENNFEYSSALAF
jgi:hypothetical protein